MSLEARKVYRAEKIQTAPNTDNLTLIGPRLKAGEVVHLEQLSVLDITAADKTMRLGYDRGGTKYWFRRRNAGTGNYCVYSARPFILVEDEAPCAMVESPTAKDVCTLYARGTFI